MLLVVGAAVAVPLLLRQVDDEIRRQVLLVFREHYPDFRVEVRSAQRIENEGIRIRGLSMTEREADGPLAEAVYVDEIHLACSTELPDLLSGQLGVSQITLRHPTLRATRRPDGKWSVESLLPLPKLSDERPTISIENAVVELFDPLKHPSSTYTLRDISLLLRPAEKVPELVSQPGATAVEGSFAGDYLEDARLQGWYDLASGQWRVEARIEAIELSPELRRSLPEKAAGPLRRLGDLRGRVGISLTAASGATSADPIEFRVDCDLAEGRLEDRRLPYPLTDIRARAEFHTDRAELKQLTAQSGRTKIELRAARYGYTSDSHASITADVRQLMLDPQLRRGLPEEWQTIWNQFQPAGEVDVHAQLEFDGQTWEPQVHVACRDTSFTHEKFPYRITRAKGTLDLKYGNLVVRLTGLASDSPVSIGGTLTNPGPKAVGRVDVLAPQLPIDEQLLAALPGKAQPAIRSLGPQGVVEARGRIERQDPAHRWQRSVDMRLQDITVRYAKFPYLLRNVRGELQERDHQWTFRNLEGRSGAAVVRCQGYWRPLDQGSELALNFTGSDIPLDEQLRAALAPMQQDLWHKLKPQGTVGMATELRFLSATRQLDLTIRAEPSGNGISLQPQWFPYRLENLRGPIEIGRDYLRFGRQAQASDAAAAENQPRRITAEHGRTKVAMSGQCRHSQDGAWHLTFNELVADRIQVDRELLDAVPPPLRRGIERLEFTGPLNLRGAVSFAGNHHTKTPVQSGWNVELTTQNARISPGMVLENIHGSVRLEGGADGQRFRSTGWLDLDTVMYKGYQLTQVRGPLSLSERELRLGSSAGRPDANGQRQRVNANFYDGAIYGDASVTFDRAPRFEVDGVLVGANLQRLADEAIPGKSKMKGNLQVNLHLQGTSAGTHTLVGLGEARVTEADIGELPLLVSLLKILSLTAPNAQAFTASDIQFRVRGAHIYFDKINFFGDAVSLFGKGEMDFDQEVKMIFNAIVGRDQIEVPLVTALLKQASPLLLLIYVDGPLSNPRTTREPLPGVARAVEGLQQELSPHKEKPFLRQATDFMESLIPGRGASR
ncbi:MAG: hypothetical protein DWQ35_18495 [Planctomycetota bacterium]|nr:MAG: hypothetical protein DWQ35_18495 [Planctomycetota bacterium]REK17703.1 MAG: hypothetical protein DWQ42_21910 [Planctomycetota bacterium]REK46756.1 MAG: hypothetical protein DWQ46_06020 [Planctomycetota bacterium]